MRSALVPELICSDFARTLTFYTGVLGFRMRYGRPEERFAFLEREGAEIMIEQPHTADRLFPKAPLEPPFGRGVNFEITVADIAPLHEAVVRAGIPFYLPFEERWYGRAEDEVGVRQFAVQDPDGYLLRFSQAIGTRPLQGASAEN